MKLSAMAAKDSRAQKRLLAAAEALAKRMGLDAALVAGLSVRARDRRVAAVLQREAVADLLEAIEAEAQAREKARAKQSEKLNAPRQEQRDGKAPRGTRRKDAGQEGAKASEAEVQK